MQEDHKPSLFIYLQNLQPGILVQEPQMDLHKLSSLAQDLGKPLDHLPERREDRERYQSFPDGYTLLGDPQKRPGIAGTSYDTAWLASVPDQKDRRQPQFPSALQWLVQNQRPDGSWGGPIRYEHDRILSTLAALVPLALFGRRVEDHASVEAGIRYLWQHGHRLAQEPVEPVAFELLLPTLVRRAQQAGIPVPPHLDIYQKERAQKLQLIPAAALYSRFVTTVHSLEFLGEQADIRRLREAQGPNGAIGNSPAATAFYLAHSQDLQARTYLEACLEHGGGMTVPVLHPCETFELLWAAYHLYLAGVPASLLLTDEERHALCQALQAGGVSLSPTFPIPDADDTAVALLLLHNLGERVDPNILQQFALPDGHFASFPYERHPSIGVNLHVLHALLQIPGYAHHQRTVDLLLDYIVANQQNGLYWIDKWHISPYYATAHALQVLMQLPAESMTRLHPHIEAARNWIRHTQNSDGSWGFYGRPTAEETAYAILALAAGLPHTISPADRLRCAAGARYLRELLDTPGISTDELMPPMWIDKCLYLPTLVVRACIDSALLANLHLQQDTHIQHSIEHNERKVHTP